ncbi:MAG: hypothetical protein K5978_01600 [Campylobacter sp.]|nr:hypothetical protein [Campylobacter sp.]
MEKAKFKEFHFSIPCDETDLIAMAEDIEKRLKDLQNADNDKNQISDEDRELIDKVIGELDNPTIRAVFERLKDK